MAWRQCMQCWKPYRQANIFKHVTKKIYVCVENGMANVIVLCTFGRRFVGIPVGEQWTHFILFPLFSPSTCLTQKADSVRKSDCN